MRADVLYILLAAFQLLSALFYLFAHAQRRGSFAAARLYPHLAAELTNVLSALCFCATSALQTAQGGGGDGDAARRALGDGLVLLQLLAALSGALGSLVYVRAWLEDEVGGGGALLSWRAALRAMRARSATLDAQANLWNVVPALIYLAAALIGAVLHFTTLRSDPFASHSKQDQLLRLEALRVSARGYVVGDVLFFLDAVLAHAQWWRARRAWLAEEAPCGGAGGAINSGGGAE